MNSYCCTYISYVICLSLCHVVAMHVMCHRPRPFISTSHEAWFIAVSWEKERGAFIMIIHDITETPSLYRAYIRHRKMRILNMYLGAWIYEYESFLNYLISFKKLCTREYCTLNMSYTMKNWICMSVIYSRFIVDSFTLLIKIKQYSKCINACDNKCSTCA